MKKAFLSLQAKKVNHSFYAPNFEEVEGAYWFGSVRAVSQSVSQSVMREHSVRNIAKILKFGM